jgi:hypothetical protein
MKSEFKRFGLEKYSRIVIAFQFMGATGLIIGLRFHPFLLISSFGLAILMFFGVLVRIQLKDSIWVSLPALFYMSLNAFIFWGAIN